MSRTKILTLEPTNLLSELVQFDTTNPPGNERACILFIKEILEQCGIDCVLVGKFDSRPNLVARIKGKNSDSSVLLHGHVDVVSTARQTWKYPPFSGTIIDDMVWGRGTLDMKGGLTMMLMAIIGLVTSKQTPHHDLLLAVTVDEETGGDCGARYLVENHKELFADVKYGIGEGGGWPIYIDGKTYYIISVAEKKCCWVDAMIDGKAGHASSPSSGGTLSKLGQILRNFDEMSLPVHVVPEAQSIVESLIGTVSYDEQTLRALLKPETVDAALEKLGEFGSFLSPIFRNSFCPTVVSAGEQINVIPAQALLKIDGRVLPGITMKACLDELHTIVPKDIEIKVNRFNRRDSDHSRTLLARLGQIIRRQDPDAIPIPYMLSAFTDAQWFSTLGIECYGFLPMNIPPSVDYLSTFHAANERVPTRALDFGINALTDLLRNPFDTKVGNY